MIKKIVFICAMTISFASCISINDCECKVEGSDTSFDHYDYEGSCSELDEEEGNVTCVAR
ncbi:MAG: hypothetical protein MJZ34_12715 [Paludibacteraceae bacterium]|nr:hypothetical protein [Paludibacteraceae bacterium]